MSLTKKQAHQPFLNEVLNAKGIVLFIHGICEGPYQFRELSDIAIQCGYSTQALLLPGHGESAEFFAKSHKRFWIEYVKKTIDDLLKNYDEIIVVGHSMGCLISILMSLHYPQIKKAFLISTPLKVKLSIKGLKGIIKVISGEVTKDDLYTVAIYRAWSMQKAKHLITYLGWIPRYLDLFSLIRQTNNSLKQVKIPLAIIHSKDDEFISDQTIRVFKTKLNCPYRILKLYQSSHFYFTDNEKKKLNHYFKQFLTKGYPSQN